MDADFSLGGLKVRVHGFRYPTATDRHDADWLDLTARCSAPSASVWFRGPKVCLSELRNFRDATQKLNETLTGRAALACMEPNLAIAIEPVSSRGNMKVTVDITPDHMTQKHHFEFDLDQSYLAAFLKELDATIERVMTHKA
jgi:hypothetical protein